MSAEHLGVDIGGTTTEAVLVDTDGSVVERVARPSGRGPDEVVAVAVATVDDLLDRARRRLPDLDSVGVGVPGAVTDGVVRGALNLAVDECDLAARLADHWGRPPVVDNDVNASALGAWATCGRAHASLALLNLGTGLAAGFVLDGRIWRGARGAAGEIGHVSVDPRGPAGNPDVPAGALETYASGSGIARQADGVPAATVLARGDTDPDAARILAGLHFGVASALRLLVLTLDVEVVVVGGGLTRLGPRLLDGVRVVVDRWADESRLVAEADVLGRVQVLDPDLPVAAVGAAMLGAGHG